ncbi:hypothetical protein MHSWG343_10240 [Candidatus Mycoplasma haematohominis]|uniref:Uncharacterized protein n=1 Tax=Candidatus Mycoplasma haematohominis TaxID=1494318 RepID=A0A478FUK4_9MOLU|nr:hypothetical protein MHSWG343_10240 [Candidatus Mycoplasma haemohominis]
MTKTTLAKVSWILGSTSIITGGAAAGTLSAKTEDVVLKTNEDSPVEEVKEVVEETNTVTEVITAEKVVKTRKSAAFKGVARLKGNLKTLASGNDWNSFLTSEKENFISKNKEYKNQFIDAWDQQNSKIWQEIYKDRYEKHSKQMKESDLPNIFRVFEKIQYPFAVQGNNGAHHRSLNSACWTVYWMDITDEKEMNFVWLFCSKNGSKPNR